MLSSVRLALSPSQLQGWANDIAILLYGAFEGGCFPSDTLVATEQGLRPIGTIEPGERVWGFDFREGRWRLALVEDRLQASYEGFLVTVTVAAKELTATANHSFWVIDGEDLEARPAPGHVGPNEDRGGYLYGRWVKAEDLRAGDIVFQKDGGPATLQAVRLFQGRTEICNLTVRDLHTYAVGEAQLLAHNAACSEGKPPSTRPKEIVVDPERFPHSAQNLEEAGATGRPLTVNRPNAAQNRRDALRGRPKVPGHDLDEAPPVVLRQPGDQARVRPIPAADNRGAGACIGHHLNDVPNGEQVIIVIPRPGK